MFPYGSCLLTLFREYFLDEMKYLLDNTKDLIFAKSNHGKILISIIITEEFDIQFIIIT